MAVGKSYFAKAYSERYPEYIHVSIDDCRIEALKNHPEMELERGETSLNSIGIEEEAWDLFIQRCTQNEHVILESSGLSWRLKRILWLPDIMTRGVYTVKLTDALDNCLKRLREREPTEVPFPYSFADEEESCRWLHENQDRAPHNLLIDVDSGEDYGILISKASKYISAARLKYDADLLEYGKNDLIIKRGREMSELKVTEVSFFKSKTAGKIKAFANVTFNGEVTVRGYKVAEGSHGLFIGAPSQFSKKDEKWYDNVNYVSEELRNLIHEEILNRYRQKEGGTSTDNMNQVVEDEVPF